MTTTKYWESQDDFNRSLEKAIEGSRIEQGRFKEAITSDQLAPFFNAAVQPTFEQEYADLREEQIYPLISSQLSLNDFRPAEFIQLQSEADKQLIDNGGMATPSGSLPLIPELTPYPTFGYTGTGRFIDTKKFGARIQFSFEAFINDQWHLIERFPADAARLAKNTEDVAVLLQLFTGGALDSTVFNDGLKTTLQPYNDTAIVTAPVAKNAPLSHDALEAALHQVATTKRNGRTVTVPGGFVLLVPPALERLAKMIVETMVIERTQGNIKYVTNNTLPQQIEVVASEWVSQLATDTTWVLLPKGGKTSARTTLVKTSLRGYETPELRVHNNTGMYLGGGAVNYTDGSFDNDDAQARVRLITGSGLVAVDGIVGSTGLGS